MPKKKKTAPKKQAKLVVVRAPEKATKTFKTADFGNFANTAKRLSITYADLSSALGYAPNSFQKWEELKRMPKVAQLACEGLCRRHRGGPKTEVVIQATEAKVIAGNGSINEIHPGLFVVQL